MLRQTRERRHIGHGRGQEKIQGKPAGRSDNRFKALSALIEDTNLPGCADPDPPDPQRTTAYLDSAASASILRKDATCAIADIQ